MTTRICAGRTTPLSPEPTAPHWAQLKTLQGHTQLNLEEAPSENSPAASIRINLSMPFHDYIILNQSTNVRWAN